MKTANFYYKNNRLQQLRGFCNVVKFGGFTKAAEKMGLVQSTISLQVKTLQDDLGVVLLKTDGGKISLTIEGKRFYEKALAIVAGADSLFKEFWREAEAESKMSIKIAAHSVASAFILPKPLAELKKQHPACHIKLSTISKNEAMARLTRGEIDMAVYPCPVYEEFPPEVSARAFLKYNICMLVPRESPLAALKDGEITMEDIMQHKLLYEDEDLMTSSKIIRTFKENNIASEVEFENVNWEVMAGLSKAGLGIAGFDELYCKEVKCNSVVPKSIAHLLPPMSYFIFTHKFPSNPAVGILNMAIRA